MDPVTGALIAGGVSFGLGSLFGKKKKPKQPPRPQLSETGRWAQGKLYRDIERGMSGQGLTPDLAGRFGRLRLGWLSAYRQAKPEFESHINRMIPRGDTKVRSYLRRGLHRGYLGGMDELRSEELATRYGEQQESLGMGLEALAGEKGMALNITQLFNQQKQADLMNKARFGTFGTNLASGIGGMAGWMMPASQRYAIGMAGRGA